MRELGPDEADLFAATAVAGFGMPPPMSAWLRQIVGKTGWRCFASFLDGAPVGAGALFVQGDYAWLGVGATRPEARKRGLHSALLARRIEAAHRAGARFVVTETGVPQAASRRRAIITSSPPDSGSPTSARTGRRPVDRRGMCGPATPHAQTIRAAFLPSRRSETERLLRRLQRPDANAL